MLADESPLMHSAIRKFVAVLGALALLVPCVSALAETIPAADLPPCCTNGLCPLHHRDTSSASGGKTECSGMPTPGQKSSSMRACDSAPNPVAAAPVYDLAAPAALRGPAVAPFAAVPIVLVLLSAATIPATPPPRLFLS